MVAFTDFLANNYLWFLVVSLILLFELIGYFVDQKKKKKGVSMFQNRKEDEKDIHDLAAMAGGKTLNTAVTDAAKIRTEVELPKAVTSNTNTNTITDMSAGPSAARPMENNVTNFNVLSK